MNRTQILHLNVGKRRLVQNSLLNDETLKDYQALCVVEPYIYANPDNNNPTIPQDSRWQIYRPTKCHADALPRHAFRSAIWVNAKNKATQVPVECADTTAVLIQNGDKTLLLVSSYEPRTDTTRKANEEAIRARIQNIADAKTRAEEGTHDIVELLVCADWNRHHTLWGGPEAEQQRISQSEGEEIVNFMHEAGLQSLLKRGTPTWEHESLDRTSTIDLVLGSEGVQDNLITCQIHDTDHGSDHKAISTSLYSPQESLRLRKGRRLYRDADWNLIRIRLIEALRPLDQERILRNGAQIEHCAEVFTQTVTQVLEEFVPRARESRYNKRWWTKELTALRDEYTSRRNRVTTLRRRGEDTERARKLADSARRTFHNAVDSQKSCHWKEFLDNPENVWKAAKYAKKREGTIQIPTLRGDDETATTDAEKAELLMDTFFSDPTGAGGNDHANTQTRRRDRMARAYYARGEEGSVQKQPRQSTWARRDHVPSMEGTMACDRDAPSTVVQGVARNRSRTIQLEDGQDRCTTQARKTRLH